jgi:hypothetical protein
MRVRQDLVNRLKNYTENKDAGVSQTPGQSFRDEVAKRTTRQESERHPDKSRDPVYLDSGLRRNDKIGRGNDGMGPNAHHANARRYRKDITMAQAQRLAKYAPVIQDCAKRHGVPVELICGVILQESGGNHRAVSHAGAKGLMQLMPATAKRFGVVNSFDPKQNIEGGTKYLRFLMDKFGGDYRLALAGYNAGENNVEKYGNKIPPFAETRNYVPNVLGYADAVWQILHNPQQVAANTLPTHAKKV